MAILTKLHHKSIAGVTILDRVLSESRMVLITCKKCGEYRYLTPHAFWNVNDLNVKCKDSGTINIITLENGELKQE